MGTLGRISFLRRLVRIWSPSSRYKAVGTLRVDPPYPEPVACRAVSDYRIEDTALPETARLTSARYHHDLLAVTRQPNG